MTDLSIVIVNWNSTPYLLKCVESIYEHTRNVAFEIIVLDNCSPDNDVDLVRIQFPEVVLIRNPENIGFARANNLGFQASRGEVMVFLNPDTTLVSSAFDLMLKELRALPSAGAVGCTLLNGDMSIQTSAIQTFPTILNQLLDINLIRNRYPAARLWNIEPLFAGSPQAREVEVISGACLMLRREVFAQVGMFSEDYFMYAEDLDLCFKIAQAGFVNYYLPQGRIIHYGGKSSNPTRATAMKWKSNLHYFAKHRGFGYLLLFRIAMTFSALLRLALIILWAVVSPRARGEAGRFRLLKWWLILKTMVTYSDEKQQTKHDSTIGQAGTSIVQNDEQACLR